MIHQFFLMVNIDPNSVFFENFSTFKRSDRCKLTFIARIPVIEFDFSTFIRADGDSMSRCVFFFPFFPKKSVVMVSR